MKIGPKIIFPAPPQPTSASQTARSDTPPREDRSPSTNRKTDGRYSGSQLAQEITESQLKRSQIVSLLEKLAATIPEEDQATIDAAFLTSKWKGVAKVVGVLKPKFGASGEASSLLEKLAGLLHEYLKRPSSKHASPASKLGQSGLKASHTFLPPLTESVDPNLGQPFSKSEMSPQQRGSLPPELKRYEEAVKESPTLSKLASGQRLKIVEHYDRAVKRCPSRVQPELPGLEVYAARVMEGSLHGSAIDENRVLNADTMAYRSALRSFHSKQQLDSD